MNVDSIYSAMTLALFNEKLPYFIKLYLHFDGECHLNVLSYSTHTQIFIIFRLYEKRNHTQRMLRKYVNESVAIMKPKMVKLREEEMRH